MLATRNQLVNCGKPLPAPINKRPIFVGLLGVIAETGRLQNGARIELFQGDESPRIPPQDGSGRTAVSGGTAKPLLQLIDR
jgi:hypothetical protein